MSKTAEKRWTKHRDTLIAEIGAAEEVIVQIPGWQPVCLDEGLRWLQATHYEAFRVSHRVTWEGRKATVEFSASDNWDG